MILNQNVNNAGMTLRVGRILFQETGTYNDQVTRNYELQNFQSYGGTNHALETFGNAIRGGANLSNNLLAQYSYQFLAPQAQISQDNFAKIDNGWGTRRLYFMMDIYLQRPLTNITERYVLSGYTDAFEPGVIRGDSMQLSPEMKLYINNVVQLRQMNIVGANGVQQTAVQPGEMLQVLCGTYHKGSGMAVGVNDYSMRPIDIAEASSSIAMGNSYQVPKERMLDFTISFNDGIKLQSRNNNCSNRYLGRYLNGYVAAVAEATHADEKPQNNGQSAEQVDFANSLVGSMRESDSTSNPIMMVFKNATQFGEVNRGYITWGELATIDPGVLRDEITKVNLLRGQYLAAAHTAGSTAFLTGATHHHRAVSLMLQMLPAMMVPSHLTRFTFTVTNMVAGGGEPQVEVHFNQNPAERVKFTPCSFIEGIDLTSNIRNMIAMIKAELLPIVTMGGQHELFATVDVQLLGDLRVKISMNNAAPEDYCVPLFADHRFVPVITSNPNQVRGMAQDMMTMSNEIIDSTAIAMPQAGGSNLNGGFGFI